MISKEDIIRNSKIEDRILDLIDYADEFTRSDLQGAVTALVLQITRPTPTETERSGCIFDHDHKANPTECIFSN